MNPPIKMLIRLLTALAMTAMLVGCAIGPQPHPAQESGSSLSSADNVSPTEAGGSDPSLGEGEDGNAAPPGAEDASEPEGDVEEMDADPDAQDDDIWADDVGPDDALVNDVGPEEEGA